MPPPGRNHPQQPVEKLFMVDGVAPRAMPCPRRRPIFQSGAGARCGHGERSERQRRSILQPRVAEQRGYPGTASQTTSTLKGLHPIRHHGGVWVRGSTPSGLMGWAGRFPG